MFSVKERYYYDTSITKYGNFVKITKFHIPQKVDKFDNHHNICALRMGLYCSCPTNYEAQKPKRKKNTVKLERNIKAMKTRFIQKALHNFHNSKKLTFLTLTFRNRYDNMGDKAAKDINLAFKRVKISMKEVKRQNPNDFKYCYV